MTGMGVERMRTAFPRPVMSPAGVPAPLPPSSQEAERQSGNHVRTTAVRWGLRVLVVGGLAGAAWLLTGAAAQAADRADGPFGSLFGSVAGSDTILPVNGLLNAAAQPLETVRPAHHRKHQVVVDVLDVPRRVLTRPAVTLDEIIHDRHRSAVDSALSGVDQALREIVGPIRLTGGPTYTQQRLTAVTAHVPRIPHLVAERPLRPAVTPMRPVTHHDDQVSAASRTPISVAAPSRASISQALRAPVAVQRAVVQRTAVPVKHGKVTSRPSVHRHRVVAHATLSGPETALEETPGGDGPAAPLRLHLGDVSGTPTNGSGTPTEGGSAAFLPAAIASSTMACQLLPIASDVEARRFDAEAPTVSPD